MVPRPREWAPSHPSAVPECLRSLGHLSVILDVDTASTNDLIPCLTTSDDVQPRTEP